MISSCDWSRERFTLDEGLSRAVVEVFVRLHEQGLIYRDRTLINWCPRCETALSDLEVSHKDADGQLYFIRYPLEDGSGAITVATTRPETMLGDSAVAVNPQDPRYKDLIGKGLRLPLAARIIRIIADASVDSSFGTGAVKITPAHDFNDFAIGKAHGLDEIAIMEATGRMNTAAGAYAGMDCDEGRKAVLRDLEAQGLLENTQPHRHAVGVCSRCDTVLEPMLSVQWFVRVKPLADKAIAAVRDGRTTFHPKFWENTYFNWMENIHDWCISRQLWWGHRIPAYDCGDCGHTTVVSTSAIKLRALRIDQPGPGGRRARYLVQLGPVALFDFGMARRHARPAPLLSHDLASDRLRYHLLLGRAHDDDAGAMVHRPGAVSRRLRRVSRPCSRSSSSSADR